MESLPLKEKKILIIRSATRILNQTMDALKREFPKSKITIVAPYPVKESLEQDPLVDEVIPVHNNGRMTLSNIGFDAIRRMRDGKFDLAVSLYNIDHGMGYSNIDCMIWAAKAHEMRGYNVKGKHTVLTPAEIVKKVLLEKTSLAWIVANYIATAGLFALITVCICAEWCVRKLFSPRKNPQKDNAFAIPCLTTTKSNSEG